MSPPGHALFENDDFMDVVPLPQAAKQSRIISGRRRAPRRTRQEQHDNEPTADQNQRQAAPRRRGGRTKRTKGTFVHFSRKISSRKSLDQEKALSALGAPKPVDQLALTKAPKMKKIAITNQ